MKIKWKRRPCNYSVVDIDGKILLKWILNKSPVRTHTGVNGIRTVYSGGDCDHCEVVRDLVTSGKFRPDGRLSASHKFIYFTEYLLFRKINWEMFWSV